MVHAGYLAATVLFLIGGALLVRRLPFGAQNVVFVLVALGCCGGIFFRYAMGLQLTAHFQWDILATQMMQVCNFNFLLLPMMLVPRLELARQYACQFSMMCAATVFFSPPVDFSEVGWYDISGLNSWLNHVFAFALPLFMMAAGRLKPKKRFVLPVLCCVFLYFTAVAGISFLLMDAELMTVETSLSYVFRQDGIWLFEFLYRLIPIPYVYLMPLLPVLYGIFRFWAFLFRNVSTIRFSWREQMPCVLVPVRR